MVVNKNDLLKFLKLIAIKGELENNEVILDVNEKVIETLSSSKGNICAVSGVFNGDLNVISRIGVGDLKGLIGFLSKFEDENIEVIKKDNKLILTSSTENLNITLTLKNPDYIVNALTKDKFTELISKIEDNFFTLTTDIINKINGYISTIKTDNIILSMEANRLKVSLAKMIERNSELEVENEILALFPIAEQVKPFSIKVSSLLMDILSTVGENVNININNNKPIVIKYSAGDKFNVTYLLATLKK